MASRKGVRLSKALARIDALTLRRIASGKHLPNQRWIHDGGGLFLRVRQGGGSWAFRFQVNRRTHFMGLGSLAHVGAPEAREMAAQLRKARTLGQHPLQDRREERRQKRETQRANGTTFKQVAEQVLTDFEASQRHPATRRSWRQVLEDYAYSGAGQHAGRQHRARRRAEGASPAFRGSPLICAKLVDRIRSSSKCRCVKFGESFHTAPF